jgi:hypothetical protein
MSNNVNNIQNSGGITTDSSQHGFTGYLELIYIRAGNNLFTQQSLLFNNLLKSTQQSIDVLNSLMSLRTYAIQPTALKSFSSFAMSFNGWYAGRNDYSNDTSGDNKYLADWKAAQSAYNAYLSTTPPFYLGYNNQAWSAGSPEFAKWVSAAAIYRTNLETTIGQLSAQMTPDQRNDPGSLYAKLKGVLSGLPQSPSKDYGQWSKWALDGWSNNLTAGAGPIKSALDAADAAATNFLNQNTENLQIFQNLMAEYYKSCSALLKANRDAMSNITKKI